MWPDRSNLITEWYIHTKTLRFKSSVHGFLKENQSKRQASKSYSLDRYLMTWDRKPKSVCWFSTEPSNSIPASRAHSKSWHGLLWQPHPEEFAIPSSLKHGCFCAIQVYIEEKGFVETSIKRPWLWIADMIIMEARLPPPAVMEEMLLWVSPHGKQLENKTKWFS